MKIKLKDFNIEKIRNSGQIFRLYKDDKNVYHLFHMDKHLIIKTADFNNYYFSCTTSEFKKTYRKYFDLDFDYSKIKALKSDKFLKKCISYGYGIRILRQDPFEMLISFIISQRKSIPAIRTSIERLCKYCGKKEKDYFTFPTASQILKNRKLLSRCSLGYRAPYIIDACEKIISGEISLSKKDINIEYLMKIKGVGIKVASCIMLFAYHDLSIVPVDVWMDRVINKYYKNGFPKKYQKCAGIIQQYLFNYAKDFGI